MLYAGIGMVVIGWVLLHYFGVSYDQAQAGEEYTKTDTFGGFLLMAGFCLTGAWVVWHGGGWLLTKIEQVFYGVGEGYVLTLAEACCQACVGAALLFFLSIMTLFKAEGKYREYQRNDFARARRVRASYNFYAASLYRCGLLVLITTLGVFVVKGT